MDMFNVNTGIDDKELAVMRETVGSFIRLPELFNTVATPQAIRHFAHSYGDDNPLWCDERYNSEHGYGRIMAPPTFLYSVFPPGICPGFDGLQGFHAGSRWEFVRPLYENESIEVSAKLTGIDDRMGRRSGRFLIERGLAEYRTGRESC